MRQNGEQTHRHIGFTPVSRRHCDYDREHYYKRIHNARGTTIASEHLHIGTHARCGVNSTDISDTCECEFETLSALPRLFRKQDSSKWFDEQWATVTEGGLPDESHVRFCPADVGRKSIARVPTFARHVVEI